MTPEKIARYEIKNELGRGGMATVYLAHDPRFKRDVALKVLPTQFTHDPSFRARFEREAQTIAALEHEAIVPVYDFGEFEEQPYLVMRYMAGGSLAERLKGKGMSLEEILPILARIAPGLDEAHKKGIVHRDLKPGNILFDSYDKAYIGDFGVVKLSEATAALTMGTIGTPQYMSPEQALATDALDGRSDLYSLGVVVYQLLTGNLPFEATTPAALIHAHVYDPPPDIQSVNAKVTAAVKAVIEKSLAKDPKERHDNCIEFTEALAEAIHLPATQVMDAAEELPAAPETAVFADEPAAKPKEKAGPAKREKSKKTAAAKPAKKRAKERGEKRPLPRWLWLAGGGALFAALAVWGFGSGVFGGGLPSFGGGGDLIAFSSDRDGNNEIYIVDTDGDNPANLTDHPGNDDDPAWSPDGSQIAFSSSRAGSLSSVNDIFVMDVDGGTPINLTNNPANDEDPTWSPDGRRIAFVSNREGIKGIFMMDADGSNQEELTRNGEDPAWSPDGSQIAYVSRRDGNPEVYVINVKTKIQINLTDNLANDFDPAWSPDGGQIVFRSNRNITSDIYVMDPDGENVIRLTSGTAENIEPVWSPDGSQIAFSSHRDGNFEIYVMDADGGNQTNLTKDPANDTAPSWLPD